MHKEKGIVVLSFGFALFGDALDLKLIGDYLWSFLLFLLLLLALRLFLFLHDFLNAVDLAQGQAQFLAESLALFQSFLNRRVLGVHFLNITIHTS